MARFWPNRQSGLLNSSRVFAVLSGNSLDKQVNINRSMEDANYKRTTLLMILKQTNADLIYLDR